MNLRPLNTIADVFQQLQDWALAIPDEHARRWDPRPVRNSKSRALAGQAIAIDATDADVAVVLEPASSRNKGREIVISVRRGTHNAVITVEGSQTFGTGVSSITVGSWARFLSWGDCWEYIT